MIKAILVDADGVAIAKSGYFSEQYAKDFNVPVEKLLSFFKNEFRVCQLGEKDIKEVLPKYLSDWEWQKSVDELLEYWFKTSTIPDEKVLEKVQELRNKGIKCYLVTDQEKYRAEYTRNTLGFKEKFDECFFSCNLGVSKSNPEFFKKVLADINTAPQEVVYLDDEEKNLEAAQQLGINAKLYSNLEDLDLN